MPHKVFRTVAGVHGGALVIVGLGYITTGIAWVLSPLIALDDAVSWVPHGSVNQDTVGWAWLVVGTFVLMTGLFSKGHKKWETAGYAAAIGFAALLILWFLIAAMLIRAGIWLIALSMLVWPTVFVAWVGIRAQEDKLVEPGGNT